MWVPTWLKGEARATAKMHSYPSMPFPVVIIIALIMTQASPSLDPSEDSRIWMQGGIPPVTLYCSLLCRLMASQVSLIPPHCLCNLKMTRLLNILHLVSSSLCNSMKPANSSECCFC